MLLQRSIISVQNRSEDAQAVEVVLQQAGVCLTRMASMRSQIVLWNLTGSLWDHRCIMPVHPDSFAASWTDCSTVITAAAG